MKKIHFLALAMTLLVVNIAFGADEIHWTVTGKGSVTFDWRGTSAENSIGYGLTSGNYTQVTATKPNPVPVSSTGPFWEAKLTGLAENTRYYYKIGNAPERTFRTAPVLGSSNFTVYAQGNIGSTSKYFNTGVIQDIIANDLPSFVVGLGDLTLGSVNGKASIDQHFNDVMVWAKEAAYMPVWGDRDTITSTNDNFKNYKGRFAVPNPQTSPGSSLAGGEDWYWFDYGNVRFITLPEPWTGALADWNTKAGTLMAQAQANTNIKFIVTFVHRPAYSSGHFTGSSTLKGMLDKLGDTYSKYKLNINAHSNNYERSFPQHGVTHVTAGTGGANLTQDGACLWLTCAKPSWSAFRAMHLGALKLQFTDFGIEGAFICGPAGGGANDVTCTKGSVVDSFEIGTPPVRISAVSASSITETAAKISWTLNQPATGQIEFGTSVSYGQLSKKETSFLYSAHAQTLSGLAPGTLYHYRVRSSNEAGLESVSGDFTFTTAGTPIVIPIAPIAGPTISAVSASSITETAAKISWTLSEPATGQIEYGTSVSYGQLSKKETSFLYSAHAQTLSGLAPGTLYHYRVRSSNEAGVESVSGDFTFTTAGSSTVTTTVPQAAPIVTASLSGSLVTPAGTQNLTSLGALDWTHWGLTAAGSFNHKSGVNQQISNFTQVGTGTVYRYSNNAFGYSWTDATPTASATASTTGIYILGVNNGFTITAPADTTERKLTVYVGAYNAQGKMVAKLSGVPDYVDSTINSVAGSSVQRAYTFTYKAASSGQTLSVTFTNMTDNPSGYSNVTLQGATLAGAGGTSSSSTQPVSGGTTTTSTAIYPLDGRYSTVAAPSIARPALLVPVTATEFGTKMTRISNNVQHHYSKDQPWNSDQSLIKLGYGQILDGKTYKYLRTISVPSEAQWSNKDPNKLFGISGNNFVSVNATTGARTTLYTFSGYSNIYMGPNEGTISNDDRYVVFITQMIGSEGGGDLIVFDIANKVIVAKKSLSSMGFTGSIYPIDWASISQSGNYVVVQAGGASINTGTNVVKSFDRNLNYVATVSPRGNHADLGYDIAGNEVYVQVGVSGGAARMNRLSNGAVTDVLQTGIGQSGHMSCRNIKRPGWCYISTTYTGLEVTAIKLDGSQTVERFAHHRATASTYAAYAKAVASPDGARVMWNSDWNGTATVDAYVAGMSQ